MSQPTEVSQSHICGENCSEKSSDQATKCFACGQLVYLGCFGIALCVNQMFFKSDSCVQFVCYACRSSPGELKRKVATPRNIQSNGSSTQASLKQSTIATTNGTSPDLFKMQSTIDKTAKQITAMALKLGLVETSINGIKKNMPTLPDISTAVKDVLGTNVHDGFKSSIDKIQQTVANIEHQLLLVSNGKFGGN